MPSNTILTIANQVISNVGELPRTTLQDVAVINDQVRAALNAAMLSVATDGQWSWLQTAYTGAPASVTWSNDLMQLPTNVHQIRSVLYKSTVMPTPYPIPFINEEEYLVGQKLTPFTSDAFLPQAYTIVSSLSGNLVARINPYPNNSTYKAFVTVLTTNLLTWTGTGDTAQIAEIPVEFEPLVVLKATAYMMQHYVDDTKGMQTYEAMYQQLASQCRSFVRRSPRRGNSFLRIS